MAPVVKLREVAPVEYKRSRAFVTRARGCGLEDVRVPVYPASVVGLALSRLRRALGLSLREAAVRCELRAMDLSGVEHGRLVPDEPWAVAELERKMRGHV